MSGTLHQYLSVTPESSSHTNMLDSPISETSPSLRACSTDERSRSSPSTSYTSAYDSETEAEVRAAALYSGNATSPREQGKINIQKVDGFQAAPTANPATLPTRTWKMPFAKGSAPPRALSPAALPPRTGNNSSGSPQRRKTFRLSAAPQTQENDGSFVETTSEKAAQALAKYWNDVQAQADANGKGMSKVATPGESDYVVVARLENGKRIYKIRPRSRPPAPAERQAGHVQQSTKLQSTQTLQMPPSIRLTRSIPNLRTRSGDEGALSPISRDKDGFYRPTVGSSQAGSTYLALPSESSRRPSSPGEMTDRFRKSTLQSAASIPNLRAHRDHDIFGKLLGWSEGSSAAADDLVPGTHRPSLEQKITLSPPRSQALTSSADPNTLARTRPWLDESVHTPLNRSFPYDLSPSLLQHVSQSCIKPESSVASTSRSSPFGQDVRLPSQPRLKRKKSIRQLHGTVFAPPVEDRANNTFDSSDSFDTSMKIRSLREVGSSETIKTARGPVTPSADERILPPLESPRTPLAEHAPADAWMSDTRIFDSLQSHASESRVGNLELKDSLKPTDEGTGRRHERGMSNTSLVSLGGSSLHSTTSAASNGEQAHTITVTSVPGDDRRLVIWGRRPGPPTRSPVRQNSSARMSPASFTSSTANSTSSSNRHSNQRRYDAGEQLTPPTSASSASSPWSGSPPMQKVLLAATIDRWIADMTSRIENDLMTDFFLTYRAFISPLSLCKLLITRFEWALQPGHSPEDVAGRRIVRVRTYVVFRHWLLNYFHEDFVPDRELRLLLTAWLNRMGKDERLRPNPTDLRLIKSLKKVVKRLKAAYSTIGIDQAADANSLIKTSLEADPISRSRGRSDSMASMSSLQSIREEQPDQSDHTKSMPTQSIKLPSPILANNSIGPETQMKRQGLRTSSSEDDVDLEIDLHVSGYDSDELPRIPPIIPISPPRNRQYSPSHARKSRSPQLGSHERFSRPIDGITVIPDNHRVSRAIASTVGSFSKLRRMMGNRRQPGHPSGDAPRYFNDAFSDTNHLTAFRAHPNDTVDTGTSLSKSVNGRPTASGSSGLGITTALMSSASHSPSSSSSTPNLRHVASTGTMRRQSKCSDAAKPVDTPPSGRTQENVSCQSSTVPQTIVGLAPPADIHTPGIQLDDYDSSGDESDSGIPVAVRTLRRLPAARNLRGGSRGDDINKLSHRHSIDSIASYATRRMPSCALEPIRIPSVTTYDSNSSVPENDLDAMLDQGLIPYFVPPTDSEDDDEPGDVEAALRRLEGQVDHEKQISNARRVERYLKMSEQAKSSGGYVYGEDGEDSDEEATPASRPQSLAVSVAEEDPAESSQEPEPQHPGLQDEASANVTEHAKTAPIIQTETTLMVPQGQGNMESALGKRTIQRKSSMRRFFGSTMSVSLWPMNNSMSKQSKPRIPPPAVHRSFLFSYKIDALAKHFCIIERDLLEKVTWQELTDSTWRERLHLDDFTDWDSFMKMRAKLNSEAHDQNALQQGGMPHVKRVGDVQTIIHRFNLMCKWIASEIVLTTSTAERALLLTKIIKLAFKSYQMYNFQTATQIVHALQLPSIERLKKTWSKVPSFETRLYSQLKFFCSPLRDFRLLREATEALASQWGPPGQEDRDPDMTLSGIPGALPFFGLILRDLAISSELPTYLDPSNPRSPAVIDATSTLLPEYADPSEFVDLPALPEGLPLRPLINIHKYRTIARTIQLVMTFKELAGTYPYEPELPLYRKCLTIQCLPMQKIVELSSACER